LVERCWQQAAAQARLPKSAAYHLKKKQTSALYLKEIDFESAFDPVT